MCIRDRPEGARLRDPSTKPSTSFADPAEPHPHGQWSFKWRCSGILFSRKSPSVSNLPAQIGVRERPGSAWDFYLSRETHAYEVQSSLSWAAITAIGAVIHAIRRWHANCGKDSTAFKMCIRDRNHLGAWLPADDRALSGKWIFGAASPAGVIPTGGHQAWLPTSRKRLRMERTQGSRLGSSSA